MKKNSYGFTLAELLIVAAVIIDKKTVNEYKIDSSVCNYKHANNTGSVAQELSEGQEVKSLYPVFQI